MRVAAFVRASTVWSIAGASLFPDSVYSKLLAADSICLMLFSKLLLIDLAELWTVSDVCEVSFVIS